MNLLMKSIRLVLFFVLSGCSSIFVQRPDKTIEIDDIIKYTDVVLTPEKINICYNAPSVLCRNDIIQTAILGIDTNYTEFENKLYSIDKKVSFFSTLTTLGLNAIGTISGTSLFSALSSAVVGASADYSDKVLQGKAISSIGAQMKANRSNALIKLIIGLKAPVEEYGLSQAIIDLQNYYTAGTLISAYDSLSEVASINSKEANMALDSIYKTKYIRTNTSDILHDWIFNKDHSINRDNLIKLDAWLKNNKIDIHAASFINSSDFGMEDNRNKAIKELIN